MTWGEIGAEFRLIAAVIVLELVLNLFAKPLHWLVEGLSALNRQVVRVALRVGKWGGVDLPPAPWDSDPLEVRNPYRP